MRIRLLEQPGEPGARPVNARRRAFTLIEILGVVVILGIAGAVILPQLASRDDQRAAAASRVLMSDFLYAQNSAIAQQKVHFVQFDTTAQTYRVLDQWSPANVIKHPVDGSTYLVRFGSASATMKDMQIDSVSFDGKPVLAFDVMGIPHAVDPATGQRTTLASGEVVIKSGAYKMTVTVSPYSGELSVR